jgi:hypothetical protein
MALIGFGDQIVRYELALIRFSHALVHSGSLVVRHPVDTGSPRFDFARVFGEFILIFAGPGFSVGQQVAERFCHHCFLQLRSGSAGLREISQQRTRSQATQYGQGSLLPNAEKCQIQKVATGAPVSRKAALRKSCPLHRARDTITPSALVAA